MGIIHYEVLCNLVHHVIVLLFLWLRLHYLFRYNLEIHQCGVTRQLFEFLTGDL